MHFRKFISIWALLALMIAQHSASHIDHVFSQEVADSHAGHDEHYHDEHHHDEDHEKHECPECLLTKSLQTAYYNASIVLSFVQQADELILQQQYFITSLNRYKAHPPRAPPAILI